MKKTPRCQVRHAEPLEPRLALTSIVSMSPAANSVAADTASNLIVEFSEPIEPNSLSSNALVVQRQFGGDLPTAPQVVLDGRTAIRETVHDKLYLPGERIEVTATSGVKGVDGQDAKPLVWRYRTSTEGGTAIYADSGQRLGASQSEGVKVADLDGDGDLDAVVANWGESVVWLNDGEGNFESSTRLGDLITFDLSLGDFDGDGDHDILAVSYGSEQPPTQLWLNDGFGQFSLSSQVFPAADARAIEAGDLDADGDLDLFFGSGVESGRIWLNDGSGVFTDTGQALGASNSFGLALGDVDDDGDLDAFVGNNFDPNRIWLNDGHGNFSDSGQRMGSGRSWSIELADLDGDSDLDAFVGNNGEANEVWLNDGMGTFIDSGQRLGVGETEDVALGDIDGDGDLDVFVANEHQGGNGHNSVWLNDGSGSFVSSEQQMGNGSSLGVALADLDGDGDLDSFVSNRGGNTVWLNTDISADLAVSITTLSLPSDKQSSGSYEVRFENRGSEFAEGQIEFQMAVAFTTPKWTCQSTVLHGCHELAGTGNISATKIGLPVGASTTYAVVSDIDARAFQSAFGLRASILPTEHELDRDPSNNTAFVRSPFRLPNLSPEPNSLVELPAAIHVDYATDLNPANIDSDSVAVHGPFSHVESTAVARSDDLSILSISPSKPFAPGENIEVTVTNRLVSADGFPAHDGFVWQFQNSPTGGTGKFRRTQTFSGRGFHNEHEPFHVGAAGDLDGDNHIDQFSLNVNPYDDPRMQPSGVLINDGQGDFSPGSVSIPQLRGNDVVLGDVDNDGDLDAFVSTGDYDHRIPNEIWINDGSGDFTKSEQPFADSISSGAILSDFDADGDLDAFVANLNPNAADSVFFNDGRGNFTDSGQLLGDEPTNELQHGDIDLDGDIDVIAVNEQRVGVLLNDGRGAFSISQTSPVVWNTDAKLADVNGDRFLDLFVTLAVSQGTPSFGGPGGADAAFQIWDNDGTGRFVPRSEIVVWGEHCIYFAPCFTETVLGDIDSDGDVDAVFGKENHRDQLWLNDGNGAFTKSRHDIGLFDPHRRFADVDADGDLDLISPGSIWLNENQDVSIEIEDGVSAVMPGSQAHYSVTIRNHGVREVSKASVIHQLPLESPSWNCTATTGSACNFAAAPAEYLLTLAPLGELVFQVQGLVPSQLDQLDYYVHLKASDGIVVAESRDSNRVMNGLFQVTSSQSDIQFAIETPESLAFTHVENLGDLNLHGSQSGAFTTGYSSLEETQITYPELQFEAGETVEATLAVPIIADAAGSPALLEKSVWRNHSRPSGGSGTFVNSAPLLEISRNANAISAGDLNQDGIMDFVVSLWKQPDVIWFGKQDGGFSSQLLADENSWTQDTFLQDIDRDGDLDAVQRYGSLSNSSRIWFNDGSGTFTKPKAPFYGSFGSGNTLFGDIDADGDQDAISGGTTNIAGYERRVIVWRNNGDGSFAPDPPIELDEGIDRLTLADLVDLNGDGKLDLIAVASDPYLASKVVMWIGDGQGGFSASGDKIPAAAANHEIPAWWVQSRDFDGDRSDDLLIKATGQFEIWRNEGDGTFQLESSIPDDNPNTNGTTLLMDVEGDGDVDLLLGDSVWINDGSASFTLKQSYPELTSFQARAVVDIDHDGDLDFLTGAFDNQSEKHGIAIWLNQDRNRGDANGDGNVGFPDFLILSTNFGQLADAAFEDGDFDSDGDVDFTDFLLLSQNFGQAQTRLGT